MAYFKHIRKTTHYQEEHEQHVPWHIVVELILTTKSPRKVGEKFKIERDGYYILFEIKEDTLYVINAKQ